MTEPTENQEHPVWTFVMESEPHPADCSCRPCRLLDYMDEVTAQADTAWWVVSEGPDR